MRIAKTIELDEHTERELRVLAKRRRVEARLQQRALVILLAAQGWQNKDIAVEAGLDRRQVALWRQRFLDGGIDALRQDAPRTGRPATVTAEVESRIVHATLHDKPINATHWSTRTLAEHLGLGLPANRHDCGSVEPAGNCGEISDVRRQEQSVRRYRHDATRPSR